MTGAPNILLFNKIILRVQVCNRTLVRAGLDGAVYILRREKTKITRFDLHKIYRVIYVFIFIYFIAPYSYSTWLFIELAVR